MRALGAALFVIAGMLQCASAAGFPGPAVWVVGIELSPENAASLRLKPREYVRAKVRILERTFPDAAIRLKGRGTFQGLDQKPSLTIDFTKFGGSVGPEHLTKIHLNNSAEDPSYLKERVGSEIFEGSGIAVPRVGHARLSLNGRPLGLYVLKEGFTKEFLERHFKSSKGNLYDTDEGPDVDQRMELEIGAGGSEEQEELKRLAAAANDLDLGRRWERLELAVDMEKFLTFVAVEMMICHWDGYSLSRNNFRVYYDTPRGKVVFLPSGMDQIFSKPDFAWKPRMSGLVAKSVLETPEGKAGYERRFREIFETRFRTSDLTNRVNQIVSGLNSSLKQSDLRAIQMEAQTLCERIAQREAHLRQQLAASEPDFPKFVNGAAVLSGWKAFDTPEGGQMAEDASRLRIVAGPKTAASWRTTIRLGPGRYALVGLAQTLGAEALPFGARHGAVLRAFGTAAQSAQLTGTTEPTSLRCEFEVDEEREVVLGGELRASAGEAWFAKDLRLEQIR